MQSRNLLNIGLALLVAGLALFVYLRPAPQDEAQLSVSSLDAGQVTRVVIQRPGQAQLTLQKRAGQWFVSAPFSARADNLRVEKILKVLSAKSAQSFAATDLARFGLERPLLHLAIDAQTFAFGTQHPLTNEIYVATQGRVYLLAPSHFASAAASAPDFASKMLFAPDENPVGFAFPGFTLTQDQGRWSRLPPGPDLNPDDLNQWADEWRHAIAVIAQPYAQGKPAEAFSVRLANGKTVPFQILQREPELVLLRGDENMQYHFPSAIGKRLLLPPQKSR